MKTFKWVPALTVIVMLCLVSSFSFAGDLTRTGPCEQDIKMFCKNVRPGKGRILRCMKQYDKYLSDSCLEHIGVVKEQTQMFKKACKNDVPKFCGTVQAGNGDVVRCLKQHQAELAAQCANYIK
ncbi:MAG: cysteine rich repeat-containing protein [Deltaproteobacteria bacterium]